MLPTVLVNILPKNEAPDAPPGMFDIVDHSKVIICSTANNTVSGVLWRCKAKYKVAVKVVIYDIDIRILSLENKCFMYASGPQKKEKLQE